MLCYHRTYHTEAILKEGFRDAEGTYMTAQLWRGVWVSADWPLDIGQGADGDKVLEIDIPTEVFEEYEWVEEEKPYRESLIPAAILNKYKPRLLSEEEEDVKLEERLDYCEKILKIQ